MVANCCIKTGGSIMTNILTWQERYDAIEIKDSLSAWNCAQAQIDELTAALAAKQEPCKPVGATLFGVFDNEGDCVITFPDHDFAQQHINSMIAECPDFYHEFKPFKVVALCRCDAAPVAVAAPIAVAAAVGVAVAVPSVPVGWQLVPIDPTEAMWRAGDDCQDSDPSMDDSPSYYAYKAMLSAAPTPPAPVQQAPLTDEEIAKGWHDTFSTENPYCPCNLKSFTKAVRWHERRILSGEKA